MDDEIKNNNLASTDLLTEDHKGLQVLPADAIDEENRVLPVIKELVKYCPLWHDLKRIKNTGVAGAQEEYYTDWCVP